MNHHHRLARVAWVGLACMGLTSAGCLLDMHADVPPIEITEAGIQFPGNPDNEVGGESTIVTTFVRSVGQLGISSDLAPQVHALDTTLHSVDGTTDLGFIRSLRIWVNGTGPAVAALPPVAIAAYDRPAAGGLVGPTLVAPVDPADAATNLLAHWKAQPLLFTVEVTGAVPADPWGVDVKVHLQVVLK